LESRKNKNKKFILITGAAGFVGSSMSERQLENGHIVHGIDNLITGSRTNLNRLQSHSNFHFDEIDINDSSALLRVQRNHYDEIYHFACPTGVPNIRTYGEEMMRTCSTGTENILRIARQVDAPVLYTSSAEMYGDPEVFPQMESYHGNVDPVGARASYEEGKRFGESLVRLYCDKYNVKGKIVRIFNSYGPNMSKSDTRLIPNTFANIKAGRAITIYGDGKQTRTHLFISDLLAGLETVMNKGDYAAPYNVGGNKQLTINQLVSEISILIGTNIPVEYKDHYIEDHRGREPDISRVTSLGWSIKSDLPTGLRSMCTEFGIELGQPEIATEAKKSESGWNTGFPGMQPLGAPS